MIENKIAIFQNKNIRMMIYQNLWWFVVEDVVVALTDSSNPKDSITKMRLRDKPLNKGYGQFVSTLPVETQGGKQKMNCATTESIFRIVQSIPSVKAEPFKRWLAKVGYERVEEINDPELAQKRARILYKIKGYPDAWIERRMRSIAIREELTDEWKKHGVTGPSEYEILTAEIAKAAFGVTPSQHKKIKGLQRENLRDHMTEIELLLSMIGETSTKEITKIEHPQGFEPNKKVSKRGGHVAGVARKEFEKQTGQKAVSERNYFGNKNMIEPTSEKS